MGHPRGGRESGSNWDASIESQSRKRDMTDDNGSDLFVGSLRMEQSMDAQACNDESITIVSAIEQRTLGGRK